MGAADRHGARRKPRVSYAVTSQNARINRNTGVSKTVRRYFRIISAISFVAASAPWRSFFAARRR